MELKDALLRYAIVHYYSNLNIEEDDYLSIISKITGDTPKHIQNFLNGYTGYFLLESKLMICFHLDLGYHYLELRSKYCRRSKQDADKRKLLEKQNPQLFKNKDLNYYISKFELDIKPHPKVIMDQEHVILRHAIRDYFRILNIEKKEYLATLSKITGDTPERIDLFLQGLGNHFLLESQLMICFHLNLGYNFKDLDTRSYSRSIKEVADKRQLLQKKEYKKQRLENKAQTKKINDLLFQNKMAHKPKSISFFIKNYFQSY